MGIVRLGINQHLRIANLIRYMQICGCKNLSQLCKTGYYPHSYIYLAKIFSGERKLNDEEEKLIYSALNQYRADNLKQKGNVKND